MPPFFTKIPVSIDRGEGVYVWDEEGNRYLDLTAGWGVTSIGHAHPAIQAALMEQSARILQNPNAGLTYSPARSRLLSLLSGVLPKNLTRVFFSNSGAEANDAAIKLARKVTGRRHVIAAEGSFHGRTISTASATGQAKHREKYNPLMPGYLFVPYNDPEAMRSALHDDVAAVILEPVQGEGGVRIPSAGYLENVSRLCRENGTLLIVDEIQTGFCRTGPMFAIGETTTQASFLTMAKGIAGGFPLGALAMSEEVSDRLEIGDHGGTYCGNPLACAVAYAVIRYLVDNHISAHVTELGRYALDEMSRWQEKYPKVVTNVRGKGLLLLVTFIDEVTAASVTDECLSRKLFVRQTNGNGIRLFPALTIERDQLHDGLATFRQAIEVVAQK
ncbi:aspartate aminotransferase family protein [Desulfosarcina cetonica]|uniref:aspartate aminotransferase family protein n=1 Tax=Desulfosarcina cetonica TaxID=90730 RepID=UPI001BD0CD01|nr:aminotransferase class III-fold pyridoxal phosphate-dependent enzyme [Desulfosarcina cetonica]